jgi:outer membrane protein OmpA-like peptidoglycan-associated protein
LVLIGLAVVLVTNRQPPPSIISGAVAKPFDFVGSDTIFKFSQFCLDDGVEKTLNVLSGELREFLRTNTQYNRLVVEGHTDGRHVSKYRDISNDSSRDLDRLVNESLSRKSMLSNIECNPTTKPMITSNIELGFLRAVSVAIFLRKSLSDLHISVVPASFSSCDLDTENHACGYDSDWQPRQRRVRVIPMILASGSAAG